MKKFWFGLIFVFMLCLLAGCKTLVKLNIKNLEDYPISVTVNKFDDEGLKLPAESIGDISAKGIDNYDFKIENGGAFTVSGEFVNSAEIYKSGEMTVSGDIDPFVKDINIKNQGKSSVSDRNAISSLSKTFKYFGPDRGAYAIPSLNSVLQTKFGALVVAVPGGNNTAGSEIVSITPNILGVKVIDLKNFQYPLTEESDSVEISGKAAISVAAAYGPIAKFDFNYQEDNYYKMDTVFKGFGIYPKVEDPNKSPAKQISLLSKEHRNKIINALKANKTARAYYINNMFVIREASMKLTTARKLSSGVEVDAANFVEANGVYTFKEAKSDTKSYPAVVINYWGEEFVLPSDNVQYNSTQSNSTIGKEKAWHGPEYEHAPIKVNWLKSTGRTVLIHPEQADED